MLWHAITHFWPRSHSEVWSPDKSKFSRAFSNGIWIWILSSARSCRFGIVILNIILTVRVKKSKLGTSSANLDEGRKRKCQWCARNVDRNWDQFIPIISPILIAPVARKWSQYHQTCLWFHVLFIAEQWLLVWAEWSDSYIVYCSTVVVWGRGESSVFQKKYDQ